MSGWRTLLHRFGYLQGSRRFDRQLDDELQFHIESRADELEQQGYSRSEARARAVAEFGSRIRVMEDTRAAWQFRWLEDLIADVNYAVRTFRRHPAFALTAIGCLALGIGANALIFSLVNAALLRPLPYPNADRIVMVRFTPRTNRTRSWGRIRVATSSSASTTACSSGWASSGSRGSALPSATRRPPNETGCRGDGHRPD